MPTSFELISEGRKLANELGVNLCGLLLGDNVEGIAKELGGYGADEVIVCDHPLLKDYTTDAYAKVICDAISEFKPEVILCSALPTSAVTLARAAPPDCTPVCAPTARTSTSTCPLQGLPAQGFHPARGAHREARQDHAQEQRHREDGVPRRLHGPEDDPSRVRRPPDGFHHLPALPSGHGDRPSRRYEEGAYDEAKAEAVKLTKYDVKLSAGDVETEVVETVKAAKKLVDLIGADYIVSVGRGISKDVEGGIKLAEELAEVLGGVVGGSRVAIDSGWLTQDHQVGQTGKTVHPKVYIALGISGAIQHKAGMQESECIIAVNKNENRPDLRDRGLRHLRRPVQGHPASDRCGPRCKGIQVIL